MNGCLGIAGGMFLRFINMTVGVNDAVVKLLLLIAQYGSLFFAFPFLKKEGQMQAKSQNGKI